MIKTEKKVQIAGMVIEGMGITDEDLKQEIYVRALEFDGESDKCQSCADMNQIPCLFNDLLDFAHYYKAKSEKRRTYETPISASLQGIDEIIRVILMDNFGF